MGNRQELLLELGWLNPATEAVQYCRLAVENTDNLLLRSVELARKSQSFYRSVSLEQWLRTAILHKRDGEVIVHSNVVPRQAYLAAFCPAARSCRGFSLVSSMIDRSSVSCPRSCENCALAEHMKSDYAKMSDIEVDHSNDLVEIKIVEVDTEQCLAPGVYKVLWNYGTFVRKTLSKGFFERERLVAEEVLHPNIVHCFGFSSPVEFHDCQSDFDDEFEDDSADDSDDDSDDDLYDDSDNVSCYGMYMEWLDRDLQKFLTLKGNDTEPPFSFREVLDVLLQIAEGMKHLHEKNFVHMDLKTANIFMSCIELAHSGVVKYLVKVGDFGCAQRVNAGEAGEAGEAAEAAEAGEAGEGGEGGEVGETEEAGETGKSFRVEIGTPMYTAPEVFDHINNGRSPPLEHPKKIDVYSFGVVAFQVLTGVVTPYKDLSLSQIKEAVPGGLRPNTDFTGTLDDDRASLLPFIERCWAGDPEQRPFFPEICEALRMRLHDLWKKYDKLKHHYLASDDPAFVRLSKPARWAGSCSHERVLCDQSGIV